MAGLYQVTYLSAATELFSETALAELLELARVRNAQLGVTGFLLYCDGGFLQVIEGERPVVETLYERIRADVRHGGFITLLERCISVRDFESWAMAFHLSPGSTVRNLTGLSEFLDGESLPDHMVDSASARTITLIRHFRETSC